MTGTTSNDAAAPSTVYIGIQFTVCEEPRSTLGKMGVEMEALTSVQIGLLTIYDMCKAVDRGMIIDRVRVLEKHGGKSGDWQADALDSKLPRTGSP